ncbi:SdrD B-like domain-containing protein [Gemmata sp.]|uniref:SdrD B-like domain-containing protein n=1 Tax=Gemmata sp. TaxID=1914242 RepID=UPI003F72CE68
MLYVSRWLARLHRPARPIVTRPKRDKMSLLVEQLECRDIPSATFTGTVLQDFNANGRVDNGTTNQTANAGNAVNAASGNVRGSQDSVPLAGVTVTAYDATNMAVGTATSAANGTYTLTVPDSVALRVQFTVPASLTGQGYTVSPQGADNGTTVQFFAARASGSSTPLNFTVVRNGEFSVDNPQIITAQYLFGDQVSGPGKNLPAVRGSLYNAGAVNTGAINLGTTDVHPSPYDAPLSGGATGTPTHTFETPAGQVGTVFGLAYNQANNEVYASAYTKLHTGYGPTVGAFSGNGTVYTIDPTTGTATKFVNLNELFGAGRAGFDFRAGYTPETTTTVGASQFFEDSLNVTSAELRNGSWDTVGKTSLGGIAYDPVNQKLFVMNLADRMLYVIPTNLAGPVTVGDIETVSIPFDAPFATGTAGDDLRPFAVTYHQGQIYVGIVNSAESTITVAEPGGDPTQLRAYVYAFDPVTNTFGASPVFTTGDATEGGLAYPRDFAARYTSAGRSDWKPWTPTFKNNSTAGLVYAQPMLSGISFDVSGNMTLAFRDRVGDQGGNFTPANAASITTNFETYPAGELLRAAGDPVNGWTLESGGRSDGLGAGPTNRNFGPGTGPGARGYFYHQQDYAPPTGGHGYVTSGSVTQVPGFPDLVVTSYDPVLNRDFQTGGVRWMDNTTTGSLSKAYYLYLMDNTSTVQNFGKASGIGGVTYATPAAPVEIGNRVWRDANGNGTQDAGESPIAGVTVKLFAQGADPATATPLGTAVTDANGNYYFSSDPNRTDTTSADYGIAGLTPGTTGYTVVFDTASAALTGMVPTFADRGGDDTIDSDAVLISGFLRATVDTGGPGSADHSVDAGFYTPVRVGDFVWDDLNGNGLQDNAEPGIAGVTLTLTGTDGAGNAVSLTDTTDADGKYLFDALPPGTYAVEVDAANFTAGNALFGYVVTAQDRGGDDALDSDDPTGTGTTPAALTSGGEDLTLDFGYYRPVTVGDFVWNDANANGIQDTGELGIAGVTLTLAGTDGAGNAVSLTDTTDADGKYEFTALAPGTYQITVAAANFAAGGTLRGYSASPTGQGTAATDSNGSPSGTTPLALESGDDDPTIDFGYYAPVTIGDFVWHDLNGNGLQDNGEPGIAGVVLLLTGTDSLNNPVTGTATTDANGKYQFVEDPGTYVVSVDPANSLAGGKLFGFVPTARNQGLDDTVDSDDPTGTATTPDTLAIGDDDPTIDFGFYQPVTVGNFVWDDLNGNGVQDGGEPGIAGVTLTLTGTDGAGNPVTLTDTTDADGKYLFDALPPGAYSVEVTDSGNVLDGYVVTARDQGADDALDSDDPTGTDTTPDTLAIGDDDPTIDFGYYRPVAVGNFVWLDTNRDGIQDTGELGIAGVTLTLAGTDGLGNAVTDTAVTDADGKYEFTDLPPGAYAVTVAPANFTAGGKLAGFLPSPTGQGTTATDSNGSPSGTTPASLPSGAIDPDLDFGFFPTADLSLTKTVDRPAAAIGTRVVFTVTVRNDGPIAATGVSVLDQLPAGFTFVRSSAGAAYNSATGTWTVGSLAVGGSRTMTITARVTAAGPYANFAEVATSDQPDIDSTPGNGPQQVPEDDEATAVVTPSLSPPPPPPPPPPAPASLSGLVYVDSNNDGVRQASEPVIPGATVTLFNSTTGAKVATTTTAANGTYAFTNLAPGTYRVTETQPAGYADGKDTVGSAGGTLVAPDTITAIPLTAGTNATGYNFGELRPGLGGKVFLDTDKDGTLDPGETGIPGVTITLRNADGTVVGTAATDASGNYVFPNLAPGTYTVTETQPTIYGNPPAGPFAPDARTVTITSAFVTEQNFGDTPAGISGFVYQDPNNDGVKQPSEAPIPGATVTLFNAATGAQVGTTTTGADGGYNFNNLPAGTYRVAETQPAGFTDGRDSVGSVGGTLVPTDTTTNIVLPAGVLGTNYNFGELTGNRLSGTVYFDDNQDSVYQPAGGDRPLPGIPVTLRNAAGAVVGTTLTAADGSYSFANLPAGTYTLTETQPAGYGSSEVPFNVRTVTMPATGSVTNQNFGDTLGSIAGRVYRDYNLNAVFDTASQNPDTGLAGVRVTLRNGAGVVVATTTTNANGMYRFTGLVPGRYTVAEAQPPRPTTLTNGFYDGADNLGNLGGTLPVKNSMSLVLGVDPATRISQNGRGYNFGELPPADPNGYVYLDVNRNGVRDAGDRGIAGVAITISGTAFAGTPFARPITGADVPGGSLTVLTNANGFYEFNPIPPGVYAIREAQPAGFLDGLESNRDPSGPAPTVGNDVFSNILLNPFPVRGPFDFGELLPAGGLAPSKRDLLGSAM